MLFAVEVAFCAPQRLHPLLSEAEKQQRTELVGDITSGVEGKLYSESSPENSNSGLHSASDFLSSSLCVQAERTLGFAENQIAICSVSSSVEFDASSLFFKRCVERASSVEKSRDLALNVLKTCPKGGAVSAEDRFYIATAAAANGGSKDAQLCYLRGRFDVNRAWTEVELQAFRRDAPNYISAAMERGDWRVVQLLWSASPNVVYQYGLMSQAIDGLELTRYRMNRLLRLGSASPQYNAFLDNNAPAMRMKTVSESDEKDSADRWAEEIYRGFFKSSERLTEAPLVCSADVLM